MVKIQSLPISNASPSYNSSGKSTSIMFIQCSGMNIFKPCAVRVEALRNLNFSVTSISEQVTVERVTHIIATHVGVGAMMRERGGVQNSWIRLLLDRGEDGTIGVDKFGWLTLGKGVNTALWVVRNCCVGCDSSGSTGRSLSRWSSRLPADSFLSLAWGLLVQFGEVFRLLLNSRVLFLDISLAPFSGGSGTRTLRGSCLGGCTFGRSAGDASTGTGRRKAVGNISSGSLDLAKVVCILLDGSELKLNAIRG
jgi:hypothetical protein